jgi:FhuF-like iron-sulfur protein/ferric iron reductase FhuF-like transporter
VRQGLYGREQTVIDGSRGSPIDRDTVAWVLGDVARLGPLFAVTAAGPEQTGAAWRPLRELPPSGVRSLIDMCAERFGITERRVAASILFQGLATRLWSPVVAAAAAHGVVPELSGVRWRWPSGASIALWLPEPGGWSVGDSVRDRAELLVRTVVDEHLRALAEKISDVGGVSERLLWGNAASALAGTLHVRAERPALDGPLGELIRCLLALEPLTGTGTLSPHGSFARRSCCLYYRVPPGGTKCGDCVLHHPPRMSS